MGDQSPPTLLSSCALATSARESRFRVDYPNSETRVSRIFALDRHAAEAMFAITEDPWRGAHFLTLSANGVINPENTSARDLPLSHPGGAVAYLEDEIAGADLVVLISSSGENAGAAEVIAREAFHRNIMTAGLALADKRDRISSDRVVNSMRPFVSVLVVASDEEYIPAMLTALRA